MGESMAAGGRGNRSSTANNIGFLRLVFASLVIVGHAPEQIDGNRLREPLYRLTHTVTLGGLSVDAFFVLSGYLIAESFVRAPTLGDYALRRIARIYPAFVAAFLASVFLLGPLVGARPMLELPKLCLRILTLQSPPIQATQLVGLPYRDLNGSLWTIAYEFRCYLLVAVLGLTGILGHRRLVLGLFVIGLAASILVTYPASQAALSRLDKPFVQASIGDLDEAIRLTTIFLAGTSIFLYRDALMPRLTPLAAIGATLLAGVLVFAGPHSAEAGLGLFGGVALIWLAFKADLGPLQKINDRWDISYGVYLYGWPAAIAILWFDRGIEPWRLALLALAAAGVLGAVSWWGLERPVRLWVQHRSRRRAADLLAAGLSSQVQPTG
jgi:peptidoglycan/LPS O-acetylase OafA/YrhL